MNRATIWKWSAQIAAVILGVVFLLAAFSKIGDLAEFHLALGKLRFLPVWGCGLATLILPGLELTLGLCLLSQTARHETAFLATGLLLLFLGLSVHASLTGTTSGCGCFKLPAPAWMNLSGKWVVARNAVFFAMSLLVLLTPLEKRPFAVAQGDKL